MKKLTIFFFIICAVVFILSSAGFADETQTYLRSEHLFYNDKQGMLVASGEVSISLEGISIFADELVMNTKVNIITAEGNVTLEAEDYRASGSMLVYWLSNEAARFDDFKASIAPETVNGTLYLTADEVNDYMDCMKGSEGSVTTCDYSEPHYITKAKKVEYYPDDKIVGYNVTFYIGKVPVLWAPVVVYSLQKRRSKMPVMGHNDVEGDFIKTSWDYYFNQNHNGLLLIDLMQKKGLGTGIDHDYILDENNSGNLFLYHINEQDTGYNDWVTKIKHNLKVSDKTRIALEYGTGFIYLISGGRVDETKFNFDFNYRDTREVSVRTSLWDNRYNPYEKYTLEIKHSIEKYSTRFYWENDQNKSYPRYKHYNSTFSHSQPLADNLDMNLNMRYFNNITNEALPGDARLEPYLELTYRQPGYRVKYYEDRRVDLDGELYRSDNNDEYRERMPEIVLSPDDVYIYSIRLQSEISTGWFHEAEYIDALGRVRHFSTQRDKLILNASKSIPLIWGTTLGLGGGVTQQYYHTGDARYGLHEEVSLTTDLFSCFRHEAKYKRDFAEGNTPFIFDRIGSIAADWRDVIKLYYADKVVWTTDGGYNFETKKYYNVNSSLDIRPDRSLNIRFSSGFDIEQQRYLDFISRLSYVPHNRLSLNLNSAYEMNYGYIKSADTLVSFEIGENWQDHWSFKFSHRYDLSAKEMRLMDVMIVKDLHCWEMKYTYSEYAKQYTVTFSLKAFPDIPFGWNTGRGFYFEGFEQAKGEITGEFQGTSPSRY